MNADKIKRMLDACYVAKRIRELLPELPQGVKPAYIQYMDIIHQNQKYKKDVKVSDISDTLKVPRPGVTRTVKEMEGKGYLRKYSSEEDGRITYIAITPKGEALSEKYDKNYCIIELEVDYAYNWRRNKQVFWIKKQFWK